MTTIISTPFIRLSRSSAFALSTGANVSVDWNAEQQKRGITHDNATNPDRITIVTPGRYQVQANLQVFATVAFTAGSVVAVGITVNGTTVATTASEGPGVANNVRVVIVDFVNLAAGDIVRIYANATFASGAASVNGDANGVLSYCSLFRVTR